MISGPASTPSESQPSKALFQGRRDAIRQQLQGPAMVAAGWAPSRNYPATRYVFRASSHFLFLVGEAIPGAVLMLTGDGDTLYVPPPPPGDALWHGPTPSMAERSERMGLPVKALPDLAQDLAKLGAIGTIPTVDPRARGEQAALLGRDVAFQRSTAEDIALQEAVIAGRLHHDAYSQAQLRLAAEATVAAHHAGMAATGAGVFEREVWAAMSHELTRRGCGTAYGPIVSVHGEVLHNETHLGRCAEGDLLLADVGAETASGYAGDVTRTWPVSGKFTPTQKAIYEVVLASEEAAIRQCTVGTRYRDVHLTASRVLCEGLIELGILKGRADDLVERGVHALFFPHGVGHLIGLDVHDMEDLGDRAGYGPGRERSPQFGLGYLRCDRDLESGMAVTIEPGFYQVPAILNDASRCAFAEEAIDRERLADFSDVRGIRIEDDVLITTDGPEVLTEGAAKTVAAVEAQVGSARP